MPLSLADLRSWPISFRQQIFVASCLSLWGCGQPAFPGEPGSTSDLSFALSVSEWTPWTTDGASPIECPSDRLVSGARCRGRYCDDVALRCTSGNFAHGASAWTETFSEEQEGRICAGTAFVTGIRCEGRYCDSLALRCTEPAGAVRKDRCYWSATLSEEDGGTFEFPEGMFLSGVRCEGRYCDRLRFYLCGAEAQPVDAAALARQYAPSIRFDSQFGTGGGKDSKCFPGDAGQYYEARKQGVDPIALCNQSYPSIESASVPVYYLAEGCGKNVVIVRYWIFYAWQSACLTLIGKFGHHAADWESIMVKIQDGALDRVAFFQHGGWYTKCKSTYETIDGTHPVAYAGKNAHGSFHDSGGSGGCLYWEDFRNPGDEDMRIDSWRNLTRIHRGADAPEWMRCTGDGCFDGVGHPIEQTGSLCAMAGCGKDGCGRSDIGGSVPF